MFEKIEDWTISSQAPEKVKVQRLGSNPVEPSGSKRLAPEMGDDIVCSHMKVWASKEGYGNNEP
jgi:hypothetical protein